MSRKIGEELDSDIHFEMLNSFTLFIEHFSPVLDKAETYHKHIVAENLINPSESNKEKLEINLYILYNYKPFNVLLP